MPTKPWKRPNPNKKPTRLTAASRSKAKARAKRAGRRYPNLVDNMRALAEQHAGASGPRKKAVRKKAIRKKAARKKVVKKKTP